MSIFITRRLDRGCSAISQRRVGDLAPVCTETQTASQSISSYEVSNKVCVGEFYGDELRRSRRIPNLLGTIHNCRSFHITPLRLTSPILGVANCSCERIYAMGVQSLALRYRICPGSRKPARCQLGRSSKKHDHGHHSPSFSQQCDDDVC